MQLLYALVAVANVKRVSDTVFLEVGVGRELIGGVKAEVQEVVQWRAPVPREVHIYVLSTMYITPASAHQPIDLCLSTPTTPSPKLRCVLEGGVAPAVLSKVLVGPENPHRPEVPTPPFPPTTTRLPEEFPTTITDDAAARNHAGTNGKFKQSR